MYLEIGLLILIVIFIVLIIFCIPVFLQIWRISKDVRITLQALNQSLPAILKNMEEITANVNNSTAAMNKRIQNFTDTSGRSGLIINDIIDNIQYFAPLAMKLPVFHSLKNVIAIVKGMRVFMDVLLNKEKV
ncbi:MAG: hypothetical protein NTW65_02270 [Deltaproteobacteria bacterium]|nr:hypothetical protein [Deltaproteobacteria bacterium]